MRGLAALSSTARNLAIGLIAAAVILGAFILGVRSELGASEGPAERLGRAIDQTVDDAQRRLDAASE